LREEYKSAAKKEELVRNLRFRITLLALLNFIFCPVIFLYQLLYSFFSYAELLKNQPGVFGRRRWSLYGRWYLRDFNELEHEFSMRLSRAYKPSVKYMDLFADPLMTLIAKNLAFIAGSLLAVLLVLTVIQEQLLTTNNVLTFITVLGG
jgi:autophagy-related protein 9